MNILNEGTFRAIKRNNPTVNLQQSNAKIYPYGAEQPLTVLGQITAKVVYNSTSRVASLPIPLNNGLCLLRICCTCGLECWSLTVLTNVCNSPRAVDVLQLSRHFVEPLTI